MKRIEGKILYDIYEVADKLGVTDRSVYEYIRAGRLRAVKFGRSWYVSKEGLQNFLDGEYSGQLKDVKCRGCEFILFRVGRMDANTWGVDRPIHEEHEGDISFFRCPNCQGKNLIVATVREGGGVNIQIIGFEAENKNARGKRNR